MTSQNSRPDIYDPKTIAVMDRAFAAIWNQVRADDPFRDYAPRLRVETCHRARASEPSGRWGDRSYSASMAHRREAAFPTLGRVLINRQPNQTWMRRSTSVIAGKADMARTCRYVR